MGIRGRSLGLLAAATLLAGCGEEQRSPAQMAACGVPDGTVLTGPFCLTRAGTLATLGTERQISCRERAQGGEPASLPAPRSLNRCRTRDGTRFTLAVYASPQEALRARPTLLEGLGLHERSGRVTLEHNLIVVVDRRNAAARRLQAAVEELGDDVT